MRKDMGKCVLERPRRGSSARSYKVRHHGKIVMTEDGPEYFGAMKIKMHMGATPIRTWDDEKSFTDVIGPLRGYLRSSCGRPWNDVFSEISGVLGNAGYALGHIITDHVDVATHTWRGESGKVWDDKDGTTCVSEGSWRASDFYVEPETGILRATKRTVREKKREPITALSAGGQDYRLIDGIWYVCVATILPVDDIMAYRIVKVDGKYTSWDWASQEMVKIRQVERPMYREDGESVLNDGRRVTLRAVYRRDIGPHEAFDRKRQVGKKELKVVRAALTRMQAT